MRFQLDVGAWRIGMEDKIAPFLVDSDSNPVERSLRAQTGDGLAKIDAAIEVLHRISGMRPHALLAAQYVPEAGQWLHLQVARGGAFDLTGPAVSGPLGVPLVAGLPPDLADAAAEGFSTSLGANALRAGQMNIPGGAIDVDSSPFAFHKCGAVLREVLMAQASGGSLEQAVRSLVLTW